MQAWAVFKQLAEGKVGLIVSLDNHPIEKKGDDLFTINSLEPMPLVYHEPGTGIPVVLKPIETLNKEGLWNYLCKISDCCYVCGEPLKVTHFCYNVQSNL